jgi:glycerate kinase
VAKLRIVIAPDSFKGSAKAIEVGQAIRTGWWKVFPDDEVVILPVADGGEGTTEALVFATGGNTYPATVRGPIGAPVTAQYGVLGDGETAVLEMAQASGLPLVPDGLRNPMKTSTYGTGELLLAALDRGAGHILMGIGGSATNDGGAGMLQALGARLLDSEGNDIAPGAEGLQKLARVDLTGLDPRLKNADITVACDVTNPLCGPKGAAATYGPQKGATPDMVPVLDAALAHYADVLETALHGCWREAPGAGAAGGLGFGLMSALSANLRRGVELVMDAVRLDEQVASADIVFTGEGRTDWQTAFGKVPVGVAARAKQHGVPVVAIAGGLGDGAEDVYGQGVDVLVPIPTGPMTLETAMQEAGPLITAAAERVARIVKLSVTSLCRQ